MIDVWTYVNTLICICVWIEYGIMSICKYVDAYGDDLMMDMGCAWICYTWNTEWYAVAR